MRGWLARAVAGTAARGRGRTRVARWSRWFPRTGPVEDDAFQAPGEPYPRHWRRPPAPWPPVWAADPEARRRLLAAVEELPATWRAVLRQRDIEGRDGEQVARDLGVSVEQQRTILNQARAAVRHRLDDLPTRGDGR
ncbi:MAG TPA: sigma factor-like helix-turn-helix DNA-binding protein [Mycobacteriales bacterium]|nr:sigma factor-like helix-turn-helix DNA-binding protein [Mycobacteriales bacterium]